MDVHSVIYGADLIPYLKKIGLKKVASNLDPEGANIVVMSLLHNDVEIRTFMYLKLKDRNDPFEMQIEFPIDLYNQITHKVYMENGSAPN